MMMHWPIDLLEPNRPVTRTLNAEKLQVPTSTLHAPPGRGGQGDAKRTTDVWRIPCRHLS